jgi:hypothetical protein
MTTDAARVVDDLGPLDALICLLVDHCFGSLYLREREFSVPLEDAHYNTPACDAYKVNSTLKPELQRVADHVEIARPRMTIVLPHVVQLKSEMLVNFLCHAGVDAIANPGVKVRVIKDFIRDEAVEFPNMQRMFELHSIAVMNEIEMRRSPMIFQPVSIA